MNEIIYVFLKYFAKFFETTKDTNFFHQETFYQNGYNLPKFLYNSFEERVNLNKSNYCAYMSTINCNEENFTGTACSTHEPEENTLANSDIPKSSVSTPSISSKKTEDGSGSIFSWRSRRKGAKNSDSNFDGQNVPLIRESKSKIPVAKSKIKIQNAQHKETEEKHGTSFLKRLISKQNSKIKSEENGISPKESDAKIKSEVALPIQPVNEEVLEIPDEEESCFTSYSSYASAQPSSYHLTTTRSQNFNLNFADTLRDVSDLADRIKDSESHLIQIIRKYIQDRNFEGELVGILTNHAKLQVDGERRVQNLATEMWQQQIEMARIEETSLRDKLSDVVKENRKLQEENENLITKTEKLLIKFSEYPRPFSDSNYKPLEILNNNNGKLRHRINITLAKLEECETQYERSLAKNHFLEQQLRNTNSKIQNCKVYLQRIQTDNELEQVHLSQQLQMNEAIIKECAEAGDVLLEDLDALKRQMKSMPCTLNWTKFKSRGSSLPDLIHMCRSCINELAKELQKSQTEILLKDKDNLKEEIQRAEENLESFKSEQERLSDQLRSCGTTEQELRKYMMKCGNLEREIAGYKKQSEEMTSNFEKERVTLKGSLDDMEQLNKKIIEKEEELIFSKEKVNEYKSENDGLRMQIHGLKQVLTASGTGTVAKELADMQEKMSFFQSQYYQLLSEKNYLLEQLQTVNIERGTLNQYQNTYYQYMQTQQQDLELLTDSNTILKQKLEEERARVSYLQSDRAKMKEEKNVMREIFKQLKNEISRVQKLEGEVVGANIEVSRLSMIAEFNKQLGEKLQCEVADRNVKISELQNNVEQLNSAQIENAKDKVALCAELTEVCSLNDQLNNSLVFEHKKNSDLDESRNKIETAASLKLKAVEEMQKAERAALKELLKNYKAIVAQRDNLVASQNEYLQQVTDLRANAIAQARNVECTKLKCKQSSDIASDLGNKLKRLQINLTEIENNKLKLKSEAEQLRSENSNLSMTVAYLQNTIRKLDSDLNNSREAEVELQQRLTQEFKKFEELQETLNQSNALLTKASQETQALMETNSNLNKAYNQLLNDNKTKQELKDKFENSLEEAQQLLEKSANEIEFMKEVIVEKDLELINQQERCHVLTERLTQIENTAEDIEELSKLLSERDANQIRLKDTINSLQSEQSQLLQTVSSLKAERQRLESQLKASIEKTEMNYSYFENQMDSISNEYDAQKQEMHTDLYILSAKLQETTVQHAQEMKMHAKLLDSHKDLAAKFLNCVKLLLEEKSNREGAEANAVTLSQQTLQLSSEKEAAERTINDLSKEVEKMKSRTDELDRDKKNMQEVVGELQDLYKLTEFKYQKSEERLRKMGINRKGSSLSSRSGKSLMLKETKSKLQATEERITLLKDDLERSHVTIMKLKSEIAKLTQNLTVLEFQKSQISLQLHETQAQLKAEFNLKEEVAGINQKILSEILRMEKNGVVPREISEALLNLVQRQKNEIEEVNEVQ